MRTITLMLDERIATWLRTQAGKRNVSPSVIVEELLEAKLRQSEPACESQAYQEAMQRFFAVKPVNLSDGKPYPRREELYDRTVLR